MSIKILSRRLYFHTLDLIFRKSCEKGFETTRLQSGEFVEKVNFGTGVAKINLICLVVSQEENETSAKQEEKEIMREVFNGNWDNIPTSIRDYVMSIPVRGDKNSLGEIVRVFMITSSGAEGIDLKNVSGHINCYNHFKWITFRKI